MARSSIRGSLEFEESVRDYREDPFLRAAIDKAVKMADRDVLRDILIAAYYSITANGHYVPSKQEILDLYGLEPAHISVQEGG